MTASRTSHHALLSPSRMASKLLLSLLALSSCIAELQAAADDDAPQQPQFPLLPPVPDDGASSEVKPRELDFVSMRISERSALVPNIASNYGMSSITAHTGTQTCTEGLMSTQKLRC